MPEQGDIVLIPIPFTDLSSSRRRPEIVISTNSYHHPTSPPWDIRQCWDRSWGYGNTTPNNAF